MVLFYAPFHKGHQSLKNHCLGESRTFGHVYDTKKQPCTGLIPMIHGSGHYRIDTHYTKFIWMKNLTSVQSTITKFSSCNCTDKINSQSVAELYSLNEHCHRVFSKRIRTQCGAVRPPGGWWRHQAASRAANINSFVDSWKWRLTGKDEEVWITIHTRGSRPYTRSDY